MSQLLADPTATPSPSRFRRALLGWVVVLVHLLLVTYLAALLFLAAWVVLPSAAMGLRPVAIESGSMAPALDVGDVVLLRPAGDEPIVVGEVVTVRDPVDDRLVTHRVVRLGLDGAITTKGDANADVDVRRSTPDEVVGVGRFVVPAAGLPAHWLRNDPVRLVAWLVPTLVAIALVFGVRPPPPRERVASEDDEDVDTRWAWPTTDGHEAPPPGGGA